MNAEVQLAFDVILGIVLAMGGWIMGRITKSLDTLDKDVRALPEKYVSKIDYRSDIADIKGLLERISEKLDGKADK